MADWTDLIAPLLGGYIGYRAGGNQTATSQTQMDPDAKNQWLAYRDFANQVANRPYENTVAPLTQDQYGAMDMIRNAAGGTQETRAGSNALQSFLSGQNQNPFMNGTPQSQAASNTMQRFMSGEAQNPYMNGTPDSQYASNVMRGFMSGQVNNPYMGNNPYLQNVIKNTNDEVMGRMNSTAFSSGSFGNAGVANATAKALADSSNALQYQNYQNSANLAESGLNRSASMVPQAFGQSQFQAGLGENALNRSASMIPQAFNQWNMQAGLGENSLNRTANLIPQSLAFGQLPFNNANALLQSGAMQQQQGQRTVDNWWQYPQQQMSMMAAPLGFNNGQTTTKDIPGNQWASTLGGGLLGLQFGNAFNKPS